MPVRILYFTLTRRAKERKTDDVEVIELTRICENEAHKPRHRAEKGEVPWELERDCTTRCGIVREIGHKEAESSVKGGDKLVTTVGPILGAANSSISGNASKKPKANTSLVGNALLCSASRPTSTLLSGTRTIVQRERFQRS